MENITAITKGNIAKTVEQINTVIRLIDNLTDNLSKFHAFVLQQGSAAGLDVHLVNIQTTLIEARQSFLEQTELYQTLSAQIELKEPIEIGPSKGVAKAEKTLGRIKGLEYEIIMKKGRLKYQAIVLPQMLILFEDKKKLPVPVKENLVVIQKELELVAS